MLLRSSSTPFLNSGTLQKKDSFPEPQEPILKMIPLPRSYSSISFSSSNGGDQSSFNKIPRAFSETDLISAIEKKTSDKLLFLSHSGLNLQEGFETGIQNDESLTELMMGGGGGGGGGKISCGGGGGNDENEDGSENGEDWDDHGRNGDIDVYYKKLIKANPENPLLLSNYARFLKEVIPIHQNAQIILHLPLFLEKQSSSYLIKGKKMTFSFPKV